MHSSSLFPYNADLCFYYDYYYWGFKTKVDKSEKERIRSEKDKNIGRRRIGKRGTEGNRKDR